MINDRASFARRGGETEELIAMRDAFQNGTEQQRAEARTWFARYETRMAQEQQETRASAAPSAPEDDYDAWAERTLAELGESFARMDADEAAR